MNPSVNQFTDCAGSSNRFGSCAASVVVAGLGNPLLGDEGIGIRLLREVSDRSQRYPYAEFLDVGTAGFELMHAISGRRVAIVLDCAFMGTAPGTLRRFVPDEVRSVKLGTQSSPHQSDVLQILSLLERLGEAPDRTVVFGIEPKCISPGTHLSPELVGRLPEYRTAIETELTAHNPHA